MIIILAMETVMKLLSKDLLLEYGFIENSEKTTAWTEVMTRENIDIVIKEGRFFYSNLGIEYPLKDLTALRKFYKELKSQELKPKAVT